MTTTHTIHLNGQDLGQVTIQTGMSEKALIKKVCSIIGCSGQGLHLQPVAGKAHTRLVAADGTLVAHIDHT